MQTILLGKRPGDTVNLECDVIGKYVEKLLGPHQDEPGGITMEFLAQNGLTDFKEGHAMNNLVEQALRDLRRARWCSSLTTLTARTRAT